MQDEIVYVCTDLCAAIGFYRHFNCTASYEHLKTVISYKVITHFRIKISIKTYELVS